MQIKKSIAGGFGWGESGDWDDDPRVEGRQELVSNFNFWKRIQARMIFFPQSSRISATQRSRIGTAGTSARYSAAAGPLSIDSVRPLFMGLLCPRFQIINGSL